MNPDATHLPKKSSIKRWLPYFIVAAIVINTSLVMIPIDIASILINSLSDLLSLDIITPEISASFVTETTRLYANIALVVGFLVLALRARDN